VEDGAITVQTVMPQAPIARKLIGKELDDEVDLRPNQVITDIVLFLA
jgi:transcription elongation GreA/GreB family factor